MPPVMHNRLSDELMDRFGIAQVIRCIDSWAQKFVFIVKDRSGETRVLKVPKTPYGERETRETTFYRRFESLPGIPKVIDSEIIDGKEICLEKHIDWHSLDHTMSIFIWDVVAVSRLLRQICLILQPIWNQWVTHRDLKPSNIMLLPDNQTPYVIDFWIARDDSLWTITTAWFQPHSRKYWSPEQICGRRDLIGMRSDFYCLGIIGYELFYGRTPFGNYESTASSVMLNLANTYQMFPDTEEGCQLTPFFRATLQKFPFFRARSSDILLTNLP